MKVVLRSDVPTLGQTGDVVDVADGHARNHLLPKGLAQPATDGAIRQTKVMRKARDLKDAEARQAAQEIASKLVPSIITIRVKASDEGRMFGSVTAAEIAEQVLIQTTIEIDRKNLKMEDTIRELGTHLVPCKLHDDVEFPITVEVITEE